MYTIGSTSLLGEELNITAAHISQPNVNHTINAHHTYVDNSS